jgi:pyruvate/2-oxoglutarate dehydrogenase complex dihydrolipoamide acyltransferase (E2) component
MKTEKQLWAIVKKAKWKLDHDDERIKASPLAKKIAADKGIDITETTVIIEDNKIRF